jgi:hypothetical protein
MIPAPDAIAPGCDILGAAGLPRKDVAKKYCQVIRMKMESATA